MIRFYIGLVCRFNTTVVDKIMHHFTITNHMSQMLKSDQCFVYFLG